MTVASINLFPNGTIDNYSQKVREKYVASFKKEPDFYLVTLKEGVHLKT